MRAEIASLQAKLKKATLLHAANKELIAQQEVVEEKKADLKEEIEKNTFSAYRNPTPQLHALLKAQKEELVRLTALSYELEEKIEESSDEEIERLRATLLEKIIAAFPEAKEEFRRSHQNLMEIEEEAEKSNGLRALVRPFEEELLKGKRVLEGVKKRSALDYLLGRHPVVLLSIHLEKAKEEAQRILPHITDKSIIAFLEKFKCEVEKPWNRALYSEKFLPLFEEFSHLIEQIEERQKTNALFLEKKNRELDQLIEKYATVL